VAASLASLLNDVAYLLLTKHVRRTLLCHLA
jgi:hypothetical protein